VPRLALLTGGALAPLPTGGAIANDGRMAEVLLRFAQPLFIEDGPGYVAHACGEPRADGLWEGWIEFFPIDGGPPLRSPRETTQPNRMDAEYWATGLSRVYLEGAFDRARACQH
jgi:hypothetical protein